MSTDLRIGVIGVGGRGCLAAQAHRPGEGSRLVAGADVNPAALDTFARDYEGAALFDDYRRMLDETDLDAVFVASPDFLHEEHAIAALDRGLAVYLEKPMAISVEGCDRIIGAARASGAKLYVGHNMRHMPFVREMKRLIDSGAIGEVKAAWCRHFVAYGGDAYYKDWHSEQQYVNGLLLQKAVHDIDVDALAVWRIHGLRGGHGGADALRPSRRPPGRRRHAGPQLVRRQLAAAEPAGPEPAHRRRGRQPCSDAPRQRRADDLTSSATTPPTPGGTTRSSGPKAGSRTSATSRATARSASGTGA